MAAQAQRTFTIETSLKAFPVNLWFNQFSVEREDGLFIVSFGCLLKGRLLDEVFTCALPNETIELSKKETLDYLGRTGEILTMEPGILPPALKIVSANVIGMAYRGDIAETLLHNFPFKRVVIDSKDTSFEADPVALLRSPLNVQRNLIRALYQ
jgi:hypothetical protein